MDSERRRCGARRAQAKHDRLPPVLMAELHHLLADPLMSYVRTDTPVPVLDRNCGGTFSYL